MVRVNFLKNKMLVFVIDFKEFFNGNLLEIVKSRKEYIKNYFDVNLVCLFLVLCFVIFFIFMKIVY